jgi:hypothetical protein
MLSAEQRLAVLLAERDAIEHELTAHRSQREELLRQDKLTQITELAAVDDRLRLRVEAIDAQLPDVQAAVYAARLAAHEVAWQEHRPVLEQAQQELATAIRGFYGALTRAHELHNAAHRAGFGNELGEFFVRPPPTSPINDYSLRQYVAAVAQRQQAQLPAPEPVIVLEPDTNAPMATRRFVPRRVSPDEVEGISPIAPPRRVHILHGPVRTANLNIGYARLHPGETPIVSARAAHALVASGIAEYFDEPATVPAA